MQPAPDAPRHPASLTKIMTLYLLFERLEAGKIALDTPMDGVRGGRAARRRPSSVSSPGDTLKVEDAIKGLVTKSANDAAVVIAEALGGSEDEFAALMTRKAHALGMRNTTYRNASGLPNDEQITTARDQALLGIAIQERFPKYYRYFSLASFVYRGNAMRNHNRLLGKVEGVDGIKTGYTRDSGFNLVTSVKRGARHIVAVVLGGRSGGARDARMRELIDSHIAEASTTPAVARWRTLRTPNPRRLARRPQLAPRHAAPGCSVAPRANEATAIAPGSNAPITPVRVKTVTVKLVPPKNPAAAVASSPADIDPVRTATLAPSAQEEALVQTLAAATLIQLPPGPSAPTQRRRLRLHRPRLHRPSCTAQVAAPQTRQRFGPGSSAGCLP